MKLQEAPRRADVTTPDPYREEVLHHMAVLFLLARPWYGSELAGEIETTKLTWIYQTLGRWLDDGWISRVDAPQRAAEPGRQPVRYHVTPEGEVRLRHLVDRIEFEQRRRLERSEERSRPLRIGIPASR
jgi:DNA-binding PadR family transcriptional regulator